MVDGVTTSEYATYGWQLRARKTLNGFAIIDPPWDTSNYEWQRSSVDGTTFQRIIIGTGSSASTYIVNAADIGHTIRVIASCGRHCCTFTSSPTSVVRNPVVISGTPIVGESLSVQSLTQHTPNITLPRTFRSFQWQRRLNGAVAFSNISGATNASYVVQSVDVGSSIRVVAVIEIVGAHESIPSNPTTVVSDSLP
jgi:hypothetical protein